MRLWRKRNHVGFLPVFLTSIVATFSTSVFKMALIVVAPILALWWFGQPALLFQYWWHGPATYPVYEKCLYIAIDGWHWVFPDYQLSPRICPTIRLVPADIGKLIWG